MPRGQAEAGRTFLDVESGIGGGNWLQFGTALQGFAGWHQIQPMRFYETVEFIVSMRTLLVLQICLSKIW